MAEQLGTQLQQLARTGEGIRPGAQNVAGVTQAHRALTLEVMRVNARRLRRHVGAHTHEAAGKLIGQLEGLQVEIASGAGEQRIQIFDERWHHQFITPGVELVEQAAAQPFQTTRLLRQNLLNALWQKPAFLVGHIETGTRLGALRLHRVEQHKTEQHAA